MCFIGYSCAWSDFRHYSKVSTEQDGLRGRDTHSKPSLFILTVANNRNTALGQVGQRHTLVGGICSKTLSNTLDNG